MRFNKQELMTLATQPSQEFDKEGVLIIKERQEGFFRRTDISQERWCRLRGNLLFYFKNHYQWSEPVGVIVLEQFTIKIDPAGLEPYYGFTIVFEGGMEQQCGTSSEEERNSWLEVIQMSGYAKLRAKLLHLEQKLELKRGHDPDLDVQMWRLRRGNTIDPAELPICEVSLSCDNLLCDGHGRPPSSLVTAHVFVPSAAVWLKYSNTEIIQRSSNPSFLCTISFRSSDGLISDSKIKFTAFDVRETISHTSTPIGNACVTLGTLQDNDKLRIPLKGNSNATVGFLSIIVWSHEREKSNLSTESTPLKTISNHDVKVCCHRRSQSLPPRLGCKLKLPRQGDFKSWFGNANIHTYRFHSGLGGDICVQEVMAESTLCFLFPQQLLGLWINEEKELLQEVAGIGELVEPWHSLQVQLLDKHLYFMRLYSQAKQNLQAHKGSFFKPSSRKLDKSLEFAPVNLHLQRIWVQNDTLKKCGFYDTITVGAFTAHSHKSKTGGLIKLLQQLKESPIKSKLDAPSIDKIVVAHDAIQAIKQLRREVVEAMRLLMKLAKEKKTPGMLSICDDMVKKTRTLLTLWDAGLVEEALTFVEEHKVTEPLTQEEIPMSPFKRITQHLQFHDFKTTDEEPVTPDSPTHNCHSFWSAHSTRRTTYVPYSDYEDEENKIDENSNEMNDQLEDNIRCINNPDEEDNTKEEELSKVEVVSNGHEHEVGRMFLDTHAMCSSPSANYYKPTDEPEPWDLTQLNIEASVMCLVSKVKFLCGRCGSPAVRLRSSNNSIARSQSFRSELCTQKQEQSFSQTYNTEENSKTLSNDGINQVTEKTNSVRNKFTEGLELTNIVDWTRELRPSMKKLRQAMDGLLKTARLTHSVFRLQEDNKAAQRSCYVRYRRNVCFSHALTSVVTGLIARLCCQNPDPTFLHILSSVGPLVIFEGLLSYYGGEIDMWGDMVVAIEDLSTVTFKLTQYTAGSKQNAQQPKITGSRPSLGVVIPVPEAVYSLLPLTSTSNSISFNITPVFFNVGINEAATLAESIGNTKAHDKSNADNFCRLNEYYHRYRRLGFLPQSTVKGMPYCKSNTTLNDLMSRLKHEVETPKSKNVQILQLAGHICRKMKGIRFTSCKSAKDRTGMSVTLEQVNILSSEYDLAEHEYQKALDCMRSEGCRRENSYKNVGIRKYAFNSLQLFTLPKLYRPPAGTYGSVQT
ncbi:type I inositol 3,4-bisphosphate 4-phosphatase isoform X2 [Cimex lectularius]|uniref:phosphatidylinositol-3,4-bisphosphate 4-phosphatase n=1 Tax=Cimex lectularius TaxID=79782 RepID=A0A8I6SMG6_CIMLE|nr:type I inositol 3,4-bisphosphate 4-phosphatase isoform X2 [Cimex lectularius]